MIQLISGRHLTPTDKKHIEALLKSGQTSAKINRAIWVIEKGNQTQNGYECVLNKFVNDRGLGWIGDKLRQSKYTYTIKYKLTN